MNVNKCSSAIGAYRANSYEKDVKTKSVCETKTKNMDRAEFSSNAIGIQGIKSAIAKETEISVSPERISALKSMIAEGKYNVPAESVARAIFEA
ncbi:MAG: flagellar biosynthesis anti-sigma factor FlgM [Oscillospiraceae bacterium]|nr:flagellar biosynthesis anti-sigma factor FlgM [Oscillospiraceae bacterium]